MKKLFFTYLLAINALATNGTNPFQNIPKELLGEITNFVDWKGLYNLSTTSSDMLKINNHLWEKIFIKYLGVLKYNDPRSYLDNDNNTVDWMSTFFKVFIQTVDKNIKYVKIYNKLPSSDGKTHRNILLMFAKFEDINLAKVDLENANLKFAVFNKCNLSSAKFNNALLDSAQFINPILVRTQFNNAKLTSATFSFRPKLILYTIFNGADLSFAKIKNVSIYGSDFTNVNFTGVELSNTTMGVRISNIEKPSSSFNGAYYIDKDNKKILLTKDDLKKMGATLESSDNIEESVVF